MIKKTINHKGRNFSFSVRVCTVLGLNPRHYNTGWTFYPWATSLALSCNAHIAILHISNIQMNKKTLIQPTKQEGKTKRVINKKWQFKVNIFLPEDKQKFTLYILYWKNRGKKLVFLYTRGCNMNYHTFCEKKIIFLFPDTLFTASHLVL